MRKLLPLLLVFGFLAMAVWYRHALTSVNASAQARDVVRIPSGATTEDIAIFLYEKDLIRSPFAFRAYARFHRKAHRLQAGSFVLGQSMTTPEIIGALTGTVAEEAIVTIPEGFTVIDIDALLTKKGLIVEGDFATCAKECDLSAFAFLPTRIGSRAARGGRVEGYLFPDTYFVVAAGFSAEEFLQRLLSTFEERVVVGLQQDIAVSKRTLHEVVTMASLIEEETRTSAERPIVSGILWKRYDENTGLGVDATIRYILSKPTAALTATDLAVDSPYNLRKYRGLPPGPIANAGLSSIRAALQPESSSYYYYLHGKDGQIRYAITNDEHNENKAKYLQ